MLPGPPARPARRPAGGQPEVFRGNSADRMYSERGAECRSGSNRSSEKSADHSAVRGARWRTLLTETGDEMRFFALFSSLPLAMELAMEFELTHNAILSLFTLICLVAWLIVMCALLRDKHLKVRDGRPSSCLGHGSLMAMPNPLHSPLNFLVLRIMLGGVETWRRRGDDVTS